MGQIGADFEALTELEPVWHELSQDLRVAVTELEETPTEGFPNAVDPTVAEFLQVWADATAHMATEAEQLSADISYVAKNILRLETDVADYLSRTERSIG